MGELRYIKKTFSKNVHSFDKYPEFSPDHISKFRYFGSEWNSVREAYDTLSSERGEMSKKQKLILMGEILYYKFKTNTTLKRRLIDTRSIYFDIYVDNCDNFWYNCNCKNCWLESGNNYYAKLLMEVRDRLIWEESPTSFIRSWKRTYIE